MDKPRVYVETTVISYLAAWPSRDLVIASNQQVTRDWWENHRKLYELIVSQLVVDESSLGDDGAASRRLSLLADIPTLELSDEGATFALTLLSTKALPPEAAADAVHVAAATFAGAEFLLTWNCRHIANERMRDTIRKVCESAGLRSPMICTPAELIEMAP